METHFTKIPVTSFRPSLMYTDQVLMAGSCFAEHIGKKLGDYKYKVLTNPFGILYNPASLAKSFKRIVNLKKYSEAELQTQDDLFHSMDHHGSFSGPNAGEVIDHLNQSLKNAHEHLKRSKFIFISLGTSKVFVYKNTGEIVGNCHKVPASYFSPAVLNVDECVLHLREIYTHVKQACPDAHIIWTISPVRYLREGFIENQRSKANLLLSVAKMTTDFPDTNYFPAYEIMMDQLRDYRYYASDMVHPSDLAIEVIWDHFCKTYLDNREAEFHSAIDKIRKAMEHRFLHPHQTSIAAFAKAQLRQIESVAAVFPELDFKKERQYFFSMIEPD